MPVINNKVRGNCWLRLTANAAVNVAANSTVNSDIGNPADEQVRGASIMSLSWSTTGNIKIGRGDSHLMTLNGTDSLDLRNLNCPLSENSAIHINVTFSDTNSYCLMELSKLYDGGKGGGTGY